MHGRPICTGKKNYSAGGKRCPLDGIKRRIRPEEVGKKNIGEIFSTEIIKKEEEKKKI